MCLQGSLGTSKRKNKALHSRTAHGLEMFPLQRRLRNITLVTGSSEVRKHLWHIPSELPSNPSAWVWPGEAKSMYINAKISYVLCFEELGPQELSQHLQAPVIGKQVHPAGASPDALAQVHFLHTPARRAAIVLSSHRHFTGVIRTEAARRRLHEEDLRHQQQKLRVWM